MPHTHTHTFSNLRPIDRCIYCGATEGKLTDEHIIPAGLTGKLELERASCEACRVVTGDFEQFCLRNMFWPIRAKLGITAKSKHKDGKRSSFDLGLSVGDGPAKKIEIPAEEFPATLTLPELDLATILTDGPATTEFKNAKRWEYRFWESAEMAKFATANGANRVHTGVFNMMKFSQMLAKIAHCTVVAELGVNGFTPYLPDLIMDRVRTASHWIGGTGKDIPPPTKDEIVDCQTDYFRRNDDKLGNREYVLVKIRIFGTYGAPEYVVVVGDRERP